jgi:hypothetical protein
MIKNNYGEMIFNENDICDLLMQGHDAESLRNMLVDETVAIEEAINFVDRMPELIKHVGEPNVILSVVDQKKQAITS